MAPEHWTEFVRSNNLDGAEFEVPEDVDMSGLGAEFYVLSEDKVKSEMNDAYPGLIVKEDGYIPVCGCLLGSGDQYFINLRDPAPGPLYRIYHDAVIDRNYNQDDAIDTVLKDYTQMLSYKCE